MTAPLDPDVEAAIREVTFASHDVGLFASDKYVRAEIECLDALRAAIRTACVAAERRGIERAGQVCRDAAEKIICADAFGALDDVMYEVVCINLDNCAETIRALPVPESTEADHG